MSETASEPEAQKRERKKRTQACEQRRLREAELQRQLEDDINHHRLDPWTGQRKPIFDQE